MAEIRLTAINGKQVNPNPGEPDDDLPPMPGVKPEPTIQVDFVIPLFVESYTASAQKDKAGNTLAVYEVVFKARVTEADASLIMGKTRNHVIAARFSQQGEGGGL